MYHIVVTGINQKHEGILTKGFRCRIAKQILRRLIPILVMTKFGEKGSTNKNKMGLRAFLQNLLCFEVKLRSMHTYQTKLFI